MSIKNHPNFHAVNFVTEVTFAFYESLRGKADIKAFTSPNGKLDEAVNEKIIAFVDEMEEFVDRSAGE